MQSHQRTAQRKRQTYKSCITNIKWKKPLKTYSHSSPFEKFLTIPLAPLYMSLYERSWLHMQMKLKVRDETRRALSSFGLFRKRCSRLFSNYKSKTLMRGSPLLSSMYPPARLASFNLSAMAQVKKFSPIPNPIGIGRWRWMRQDEAETSRRC